MQTTPSVSLIQRLILHCPFGLHNKRSLLILTYSLPICLSLSRFNTRHTTILTYTDMFVIRFIFNNGKNTHTLHSCKSHSHPLTICHSGVTDIKSMLNESSSHTPQIVQADLQKRSTTDTIIFFKFDTDAGTPLVYCDILF